MRWKPSLSFSTHTSQPRCLLAVSMRAMIAPVAFRRASFTHADAVNGCVVSKSPASGIDGGPPAPAGFTRSALPPRGPGPQPNTLPKGTART